MTIKAENIISIRDECFVISSYSDYSIPIEKCKTAEQLICWVFHLTEKSWVTNEIIRAFILAVSETNNVKIHSPC